MAEVNAEQTVDELLDRLPAAAEVFIAHRMACVGCAMARFDTVSEAAAIYGLVMERFVGELRSCATATLRKERT